MPKSFRSGVLAAFFLTTTCGFVSLACADGPGAPMPPVPTVPKPSAVAALRVSGPGAPMPPVPTVPKPSSSMTLVTAG
jgi:hypothetical protein